MLIDIHNVSIYMYVLLLHDIQTNKTEAVLEMTEYLVVSKMK